MTPPLAENVSSPGPTDDMAHEMDTGYWVFTGPQVGGAQVLTSESRQQAQVIETLLNFLF